VGTAEAKMFENYISETSKSQSPTIDLSMEKCKKIAEDIAYLGKDPCMTFQLEVEEKPAEEKVEKKEAEKLITIST